MESKIKGRRSRNHLNSPQVKRDLRIAFFAVVNGFLPTMIRNSSNMPSLVFIVCSHFMQGLLEEAEGDKKGGLRGSKSGQSEWVYWISEKRVEFQADDTRLAFSDRVRKQSERGVFKLSENNASRLYSNKVMSNIKTPRDAAYPHCGKKFLSFRERKRKDSQFFADLIRIILPWPTLKSLFPLFLSVTFFILILFQSPLSLIKEKTRM